MSSLKQASIEELVESATQLASRNLELERAFTDLQRSLSVYTSAAEQGLQCFLLLDEHSVAYAKSRILLIHGLPQGIPSIAISTRLRPLPCVRRTNQFPLFDPRDPVARYDGKFGILAEFENADDANLSMKILSGQKWTESYAVKCGKANEFPCDHLSVYGLHPNLPICVIRDVFQQASGKQARVIRISARNTAPGWTVLQMGSIDQAVTAWLNTNGRIYGRCMLEVTFANDIGHIDFIGVDNPPFEEGQPGGVIIDAPATVAVLREQIERLRAERDEVLTREQTLKNRLNVSPNAVDSNLK